MSSYLYRICPLTLSSLLGGVGNHPHPPLAGLQMTNLPLPRCGIDDNVGGLQERRVQEYFSSPELVREGRGRGSAGLYDHESKGPQGHENLQLALAIT